MSQINDLRKAYSYVRMSTESQLKGDSLRRQLEASEAYAKQNNLQLVDSIDGIPFKDIGVSAYRGLNAQEGVLGVFLKALQENRLEPNSVLLIESLDRLSRDKLLSAFSQFTSILNAGVEIVTISDNQKYTKETINDNIGQLFVSLGIMFRANDESETKSKRGKSAWGNKRTNASAKPLTRICPAWLTYNEETGKFDKITDRTEVVGLIFKLCIETCGLYSIAQHLNQSGTPVFGRAKYWHRSYIKKILSNRSVLGEFQPHYMINGKRQPTGEPVANYFPNVVDEETFLLANAALHRRDISSKGRKGEHFSNLLTGIVFCGSCGNKMTLRNRGATPKGGKSLCCTNKLVGAGCVMPDWKLSSVETTVFNHLREVNFSSLLNLDESKSQEVGREIEALKAMLIAKESSAQRASELLVSEELASEAKTRIIVQLNSVEIDIAGIKRNLEAKAIELGIETDARKVLSTDELKEMISRLETHREDYLFRSSVNQLLAKSIQRITLHQDKAITDSWDYDNSHPAVVKYRELNPDLADKLYEDFVGSKDFQQYAKGFNQHITIKYHSGVTRQILGGYGTSFTRLPNPAKNPH